MDTPDPHYSGFRSVPPPEPAKPNGLARTETEPGAPCGVKPIPSFRGETFREAPRRDLVVKGLLGSGEVSFTHGEAKSGKSCLMTDLALAIASGAESWQGHRIKRPGQVLYLVLEGGGGFPSRLEAWSEHHGRSIPNTFVWTPIRLQLVQERTAASAVEDVRRIRAKVAEMERECPEPVVMIVVDTAARAAAGIDENDAGMASLFLDACAELQTLPGRPHVNVVAHDNAAGTRMRGSSARQGGGDAFIHVKRDGDVRTWQLAMAKDDPETEPRAFTLRSVELGTDDDGDPVRSCAVEEAGITPIPAKPREPRGRNQKLVLAALIKAIGAGADPVPPDPEIPRDARGVSRDRWWHTAAPLLTAATEKGKREAFDDAMAGLVNARFVLHLRGFCWLP